MPYTVNTGAFTQNDLNAVLLGPYNLLPANAAIDPTTPGNYMITKAGVAALTLGAPPLNADGLELQIFSNTANAHTITATGLFLTGVTNVNVLTFGSFAGAGCNLKAFQGKWLLQGAVAVTATA